MDCVFLLTAHRTTGRGDELMASSYGLLDRTVYGRQEFWEDSPEVGPQRWGSKGGQTRLDGRPTAQWSRIRAGRDDGPAQRRIVAIPRALPLTRVSRRPGSRNGARGLRGVLEATMR
jgi:hypothetical protein